MARDHARLYCSIWGDPDFRALPERAQRLYVLAISQRDLSHAGVVAYTPNRWAGLAADSTAASIRKGARALVEHEFVVIDDTTEELFVRTFIKHDRVLRQPNVAIAMARAARLIVSPIIRRALHEVVLEQHAAGDPLEAEAWGKADVYQLFKEAEADVLR